MTVHRKILQDGEQVLRTPAAEVTSAMFGTPELSEILTDMKTALDAEHDGVAIAAPQVGIPYRIFIVRVDRTVAHEDGVKVDPEYAIYINPNIVKTSRRRVEMDEGCLSVRGTYGKTLRYERATVEALDESGKKFSRGGGGLMAQIFQHEIDHLDGILFTDHAAELYEDTRYKEASGAAV